MLGKKGHSYEVDVWSLGCILYTFLVGKPPFETQTLKDTYTRIKKNEYHIPSRVAPLARNLITKLLQHEPSKRPTVAAALKDDFFTMGYMPPRLPTSCRTMAPRFDTKNNESLIARRNPLLEVNQDRGSTGQGAAKNEPATCPSCTVSYVSSSAASRALGLKPWRTRLRILKCSR